MWSYDPGSGDWKKLNSAGDVPPALYWAALAYDPSAEGFALFGGQGSTSSFSDATCAYTPATGQWARLAAPSSVEVPGAWSLCAFADWSRGSFGEAVPRQASRRDGAQHHKCGRGGDHGGIGI